MAKTPCKSLKKDGSPLSGDKDCRNSTVAASPTALSPKPAGTASLRCRVVIPPTSIGTTATTTASCVSEVAGRSPPPTDGAGRCTRGRRRAGG